MAAAQEGVGNVDGRRTHAGERLSVLGRRGGWAIAHRLRVVIWVLILVVGIPLWLIAVGITTLLIRNRALRNRPGNVPVRLRPPGSKRWHTGHAVWVHDVLAFRGSPALWKEVLVWAAGASSRPATAEEKRTLHRVGDDPVVVTLALQPQGVLQVAARSEHSATLLAPFADRIPAPRPVAVK